MSGCGILLWMMSFVVCGRLSRGQHACCGEQECRHSHRFHSVGHFFHLVRAEKKLNSGTNTMGNMPMMDMMRMMGMMRSGAETGCAGMGGMGTIDRVEGRIAFLRTELKITDTQSAAWNAFADTLRNNAKSLGEVRATMMSQAGTAPQSLVDRLTLQEKWLAARLEGTRAMKSALTNLAGTLSDDQKKTADQLLAPHMGMNAMMNGMQSGQMGGQMQPGMMMQGQGR